MCDTIAVVGAGGVLFAKNSDRDANEAQLPEWHPGTENPPGSTVKCTYLEIPQVSRTRSILISRPFWMWGAEMGANDAGVVIGNEAVFTHQPYSDVGLTGMDLLRLGLERAGDTESAVEVIITLLEGHGQGGGCGYENRSFTYHNSFLIADPSVVVVLETAGREWATEVVSSGVRSISNGLTIDGFAEAHRDRLRSRLAACDIRRRLTERAGGPANEVSDLMSVLRSHGDHEWPRYQMLNGTLAAPCMHGGGTVASSSSTAGWVSDLTAGNHWITATSAQCLALFKPARVDEPVDIGVKPGGVDDGQSLWWRHERMARSVMKDPARLAPLFLPERNAVERAWLADPPPGGAAFAEGAALVDRWSERVADASTGRDVRPWWARRYWASREAASQPEQWLQTDGHPAA